LQREADSGRSHGLQHTLVLITDTSAPTEGEPTTAERFHQLEDRLDSQATAIDGLRAQFAEHERFVSERFQALEELLKRVLAGMGGNGRN